MYTIITIIAFVTVIYKDITASVNCMSVTNNPSVVPYLAIILVIFGDSGTV